jgi:hypothetical protein
LELINAEKDQECFALIDWRSKNIVMRGEQLRRFELSLSAEQRRFSNQRDEDWNYVSGTREENFLFWSGSEGTCTPEVFPRTFENKPATDFHVF